LRSFKLPERLELTDRPPPFEIRKVAKNVLNEGRSPEKIQA